METGRYFAYLLLASLAVDGNAAFAGRQYDQCLLQTLRGSHNGAATALINDACDRLYNNGSLMSPRDQAYYVCVLQNVPGVESSSAAQQIASACRRQNSLWRGG